MSIPSILFNYSGRINRFEFWVKGVVVWLAVVLVLETVGLLLRSISDPVGTVALGGFGVLFIWMYFAIVAKRCHDRGASGWWSLLTLIPLIGTVYLIIACGILPGDPNDNRYGAQP